MDRNEEYIGRVLSYLMGRERPGTRAGCLDEEMLASYLSGILPEAGRSEVEAHLADCALCLGNLSAAYRATQEDEIDAVPQRALERAMALVPPTGREANFLEIVVRLVKDSLELVSSSGQLVSAAALAEIRGKGKSSDTGVLQVEKEMGRFRIAVEVERLEDDLCQVAVTITGKEGLVAGGIRLSLVSGEREQASYLARQGTAIFDRIPPGDYRLAVSQNGNPLGSIRLRLMG